MFNAICPKVYQRLRERTGLSQAQFGNAVGATRQTIGKFEAGTAWPNEAQEKRIMQVADCSQEEFVELVSEQLSELAEKPVGVRDDHGVYEPTTALARAYEVLRKPAAGLPAGMFRALNNKISTTRLLSLAYERTNADLMELTHDCSEALKEMRNAEAT